jgi:deazaflavin-dependent oxidoreductase (nitroreductase family)
MMNIRSAASIALSPAQPSLKTRILRAIARGGGPPSRLLAGRRGVALWALVEATGRTSGRTYRIPVAAAPTPDGFVIPLPFGGATQWARNVLATGGATLRWNGRTFAVIDPEIIPASEAQPHWVAPIRASLGSLGIKDFLRVRIA